MAKYTKQNLRSEEVHEKSGGPLPEESHRMHLILPAVGCDNECEMLVTGEAC